jgi:hypothetical protein
MSIFDDKCVACDNSTPEYDLVKISDSSKYPMCIKCVSRGFFNEELFVPEKREVKNE